LERLEKELTMDTPGLAQFNSNKRVSWSFKRHGSCSL